jgi:translocator protein
MEDSFSDARSGQAVQHHAGVSPVLSADSARGALLWFGLTFLTAALGGLASVRAAQFYATLRLPDWAPPGSVFGPVWGVLYLLMALAAWQVWRYRKTVRGASGLWWYGVALVPNALWSWLFFGWQQGLWALVDIAVLWLLVGLTVRAFWRVRPAWGGMLLPLWAWVSFAAVLNAVVWWHNPMLLG